MEKLPRVATSLDTSRRNRDLAHAVDLAIQLAQIRGRLAAGIFLLNYGADFRLATRVLAEPSQRRPIEALQKSR